jgi:hypothetical protein
VGLILMREGDFFRLTKSFEISPQGLFRVFEFEKLPRKVSCGF